MDEKVYYPHYLYLLLYRVSPQAMSSESPAGKGQTSRGPDPLASPTANRHPRNGLFSVPDTFRFAVFRNELFLCVKLRST